METKVNAAPVLVVTKSVDTATAAPGDTLTYTINYANNGNADALSFVLTDTVTSPFATVGVVNDGGTAAGAVVTWNIGLLAANTSGSVSFTVVLASAFPAGETSVLNHAVYTTPTVPGCEPTSTGPPCETTPEVETKVNAAPVLVVTKSVDTATAAPGDTLTYTINYANNGNADALSFVLTDTVTSPFATVGVVNDGGTAAGAVVTWNIGLLAANTSGSVSFTVVLASAFPGGRDVGAEPRGVYDPDNAGVRADIDGATLRDDAGGGDEGQRGAGAGGDQERGHGDGGAGGHADPTRSTTATRAMPTRCRSC